MQVYTVLVLHLPQRFDFPREKFVGKVLRGGLFADDADVDLQGTSRFHFCIRTTSQGSSEDVTVSVEAVLRRLFQAWPDNLFRWSAKRSVNVLCWLGMCLYKLWYLVKRTLELWSNCLGRMIGSDS